MKTRTTLYLGTALAAFALLTLSGTSPALASGAETRCEGDLINPVLADISGNAATKVKDGELDASFEIEYDEDAAGGLGMGSINDVDALIWRPAGLGVDPIVVFCQEGGFEFEEQMGDLEFDLNLRDVVVGEMDLTPLPGDIAEIGVGFDCGADDPSDVVGARVDAAGMIACEFKD